MVELADYCQQVAAGDALNIRGGGSHAYPFPDPGDAVSLEMTAYAGVIDYHAEELVIRARAGTRLNDLIELLDEQGQMLASEPPVLGDAATVGGLIATGLSGSRRPYANPVRDLVLGVGLILEDGSYAEFGGQVMKNVAGYDVSRLVTGSFGTFGPVMDASFKVVPKPQLELTTRLELGSEAAQQLCCNLKRKGIGLSASCFLEGCLYLRVSGNDRQVRGSINTIGGEVLEDNQFWRLVDSQALPVFNEADTWRLSTDPLEPVEHEFALIDWGFGQRWLVNPGKDPRRDYEGAGHWTRVQGQGDPGAAVFQPLSPLHACLNIRLKQAFDPENRFNRHIAWEAA